MHGDIGHDYIGTVLVAGGEHFEAIGRGCDYGELGGEEPPDPLEDGYVIVDQKHANRHKSSLRSARQ
jgi:hypothetical protein